MLSLTLITQKSLYYTLLLPEWGTSTRFISIIKLKENGIYIPAKIFYFYDAILNHPLFSHEMIYFNAPSLISKGK